MFLITAAEILEKAADLSPDQRRGLEYLAEVELAIASRGPGQWTADFKKFGIPYLIMGATPQDVLDKAAAELGLYYRVPVSPAVPTTGDEQ